MPRHAQHCSAQRRSKPLPTMNRLTPFLRLAAIRIALYEEHLCAV
jgi:hypothetical protein